MPLRIGLSTDSEKCWTYVEADFVNSVLKGPQPYLKKFIHFLQDYLHASKPQRRASREDLKSIEDNLTLWQTDSYTLDS